MPQNVPTEAQDNDRCDNGRHKESDKQPNPRPEGVGLPRLARLWASSSCGRTGKRGDAAGFPDRDSSQTAQETELKVITAAVW